jgi:hypothetical protein
VRKKEDIGDTSPARAYTAKKTISPGLMLASDATPCFSLDARPGACHSISRHKLVRKLIVLNYEGGSSASRAVDNGRGL